METRFQLQRKLKPTSPSVLFMLLGEDWKCVKAHSSLGQAIVQHREICGSWWGQYFYYRVETPVGHVNLSCSYIK